MILYMPCGQKSRPTEEFFDNWELAKIWASNLVRARSGKRFVWMGGPPRTGGFFVPRAIRADPERGAGLGGEVQSAGRFGSGRSGRLAVVVP